MFAGALAGLLVALVVFGVGARYGKSRVPAASNLAGRGGFGAVGFPGANGVPGATGANTGAPTASDLAQIFGQSAGTQSSASVNTSTANGSESAAVIQGAITAVTATALTVKALDGTTMTFTLAPTTPIGKRAAVDPAGLSVGQTIEVRSKPGEAGVAEEIILGDLVERTTGPSPTTTTVDPGLGGLLPG